MQSTVKSIISTSRRFGDSAGDPKKRGFSNSSALSKKSVNIVDSNKSNIYGSTADADDEYVEKLNGHITFLNKTVKEMKKRQDDYKSGLVDMMSKGAKPLPDLATESQAKYKEMKQALIMQINALENEKAKTVNKNLGLQRRKEKIQVLLEELEFNHNQLEVSNKEKNKEVKEKHKKEKGRREEIDDEVERLRILQDKVSQEYNQRVKEIAEKKFLEELANKRYQEDKELEEKDEAEKKLQYIEFEKKLKELIEQQEEDFVFKNLKQKHADLVEQLRINDEEYEKQRYQSYELDQLIKLGELEKDKEAEERRRLRDEIDKQLSILEEYKRKNAEKVEKLFETAVSASLIEAQKRLNKTKRTAKELLEKFTQNDSNYKKFRAEQMNKQQQLDRLKARVTENRTICNELTQQVNAKEVEFLELSSRIAEQEEILVKLNKDEDKLSRANQKLIIEQDVLEVRTENYEKTVNLQELVQQLEFTELEKTHQSNIQFLDSLKNLKNLKEEVRTQSYD